MNSLIVAFLLITALWSPQAFSENIETELKSLDGNTSTEARIRDPIVFKDSTGEAFWLGLRQTKAIFL